MNIFFHDNLLLESESAKRLYGAVKDLPIVDYHCHLNQKEIAQDKKFTDFGEIWLGGDHYKWRAMRLCGIEERFIMGKTPQDPANRKAHKEPPASWKERFLKYASIMPKLFGNPLYYFSHLELKQVFGINKPLSADTAEEIYADANEKLKGLSVSALLKKFKVEYIATTDDPIDDLADHNVYGKTMVAPSFRPDRILTFNTEELVRLGMAAEMSIDSFADLKTALARRLDYFVFKGCKIADHGFFDFPKSYADDQIAEELYQKNETDGLRGNLMQWLMREYKKRGMTVQLHFSVLRNVNSTMFGVVGADSGFDVMSSECNYNSLLRFLNLLPDAERPPIILYSLNPNAVASLANISGAFRNVHIGAAWWFNDTLEGIKKNLSAIAEYAVFGTNLGMLTDSRSFLSYSRFDFFRRILCNYIGQKVDNGEYGVKDAEKLAADICYHNIKNLLKI